jgi:DNA polymerase-3 subunit delta
MAASGRASLLLVHGEENHFVDAAVHEWRQHTRSAQMDVEVFDAPQKLADLRRSVTEIPLLDPERSILVRDPPQLSGAARRGADPPEALAAILAERAPTTSVCLVMHGRVAAGNAVLGAVKTLGGTVSYHPQLRARELRAWLDQEIRRRGLRLGPGAGDHLLQVVGADLGALNAELEKLEALAGGRPLAITEVRAAVAGDEPVEMWSVIEQLLGPVPGRGAATLDHLLAEGRSTQYLLAILAGQVRDLLLAQALMQVRGSGASLAAELRIPDWRAERLSRQARAVPPALVAGWLRELHDLDLRIKTGEIGDVDGLRILGLRAAEQVAAARRSG